jgi:hypothetical protein
MIPLLLCAYSLLHRCVLPSCCIAMDASICFPDSNIPTFRHNVTLFPPSGCSSQEAYGHTATPTATTGPPFTCVVTLMNDTTAPNWPWLFFICFGHCPAFIPCRFCCALLLSNCSLLRAAFSACHWPRYCQWPGISQLATQVTWPYPPPMIFFCGGM